ncbi:hypothetical protein FRC07_009593, partial [Ceratobasidium sp. 392]
MTAIGPVYTSWVLVSDFPSSRTLLSLLGSRKLPTGSDKPLSHSSSIHANPAASSTKMRTRFGIQLDSEPSMVTPSLDHFVAYALHHTLRRSLGGAARSLATTALPVRLRLQLERLEAGQPDDKSSRRKVAGEEGTEPKPSDMDVSENGCSIHTRPSTADAATGGPTADSSVVK